MFYRFIVTLVKIVVNLLFDIKIHNYENLNKLDGNYILCSNHISLWDPPIILVCANRKIHFMAKKELFKNKIFAKILRKMNAFPIDRERADLTALRTAIGVLKEGNILGIFPEGTRHHADEYDENNAKSGIAMIANKSNSPIIPVYIKAEYKFRGKVEIFFGEPKNYFEGIQGKINTEVYDNISKQILKDIYSLK